jgi:K+-sensing histidine kinase KdpD
MIINISKVESGQIEVLKTETDINDVLQYFNSLQMKQNERIQLSLKKKLHANENLLKPIKKNYAALTNLLKMQSSLPNLGTIQFGCEKKGDHLEFFVKDSGIGISKSQQKSF